MYTLYVLYQGTVPLALKRAAGPFANRSLTLHHLISGSHLLELEHSQSQQLGEQFFGWVTVCAVKECILVGR